MNKELDSLDIDFYSFSMLRAWYYHRTHNDPAVMEAFTRKLPSCRKFYVVCGIGRIIEYLQNIKFTEETIDFLCSRLKIKASLNNDSFKEYLSNVDFAKEIKVFAPEEGDIVFSNEPLIRLEGPIGLLEYVEKRILSILNHDVKIASKCARIVFAAKGRPVIEMSGRRDHEAVTIDVARSAYIAGFSSTSNVKADYIYGIKSQGTHAHCWAMSHETELEAFKNWAEVYEESTYLVDTYNTFNGLENAMKADPNLGGIRLDSGDLANDSAQVKAKLNRRNQCNGKVIATNDLNEYKIAKLLDDSSAIDIFGCGTEIVASADVPSIGAVYKLVKINGRDVCKIADGAKSTLPGSKQVFRNYAPIGKGKYIMTHDIIALSNEDLSADILCRPVIREYDLNSVYNKKEIVQNARDKFKEVVNEMPGYMKLIPKDPKEENTVKYHVEISNELSNLKQKLITEYKSR